MNPPNECSLLNVQISVIMVKSLYIQCQKKLNNIRVCWRLQFISLKKTFCNFRSYGLSLTNVRENAIKQQLFFDNLQVYLQTANKCK